MNTAELHNQTVKRLASEYRAKGYEVVAEPSLNERPAFLQDYQPDLIARGQEESIIVEVKVGTEVAHGARLQPIAQRIAAHPGWRFSLVVVSPERSADTQGTDKEALSLDLAKDQVKRANLLAEQGMLDASLLLLWGAVEAALRHILTRAHLPIRSLSTSIILRELFSAGELSRDQFEIAMKALPIRNSLAHGVSIALGQADIDDLARLADSLFEDLDSPPSVEDELAAS
jgi:REase_AHJR-like